MEENVDLKNFILENIAFTRTIVFKCEDVSLSDNRMMETYLNIDSGTDKRNWRYYLNLNGEYHSTDDVMYITSLDNDEQIIFNKTNLENHIATKKAYRLGSYYFTRLVSRYQHQLDLIKGIINPIPPEESIPAKDFTILRYNKDYVNWNEHQLIPVLQKYLYDTQYQLFNTEYKYTDNLVLPSLLGIAEKNILDIILVNRFENRRTRYAHSFYIWSHLQSLGISSIYKDLLNEKQTMWLFRNIEYVLRNTGKTQTFEELLDILLTERNIPLAKHEMIYKTDKMLDNLSPEPSYLVKRLNNIKNTGTHSYFTSIELATRKEILESIDNEKVYDKYYQETDFQSRYGEQNNYPIKILESEMEDATNRQHDTIFTILFNEWMYLADRNLYNINLSIFEGVSGKNIRIDTKDALVVWFALLHKYEDRPLTDKVPYFYYHKAMKVKTPSLNEIKVLGDKEVLHTVWCNDLLNTHLKHSRIISPSIFYNFCMDIRNTMWNHTKMYSRYPDIEHVSQRKNATEYLYDSGLVEFSKGLTYQQVIDKYELDFSDYSKREIEDFMWEIWKKATGWDTAKYVTLAQQQEGLIELFKFLSSYTTQFIYNTTAENGVYEVGTDLFTSSGFKLGLHPPTELGNHGGNNEFIPVPLKVWSRHQLEKKETLTVESEFSISAEMEWNSLLDIQSFMIQDEEKEGNLVMNAHILEGFNLFTDLDFVDPYDSTGIMPKSVTSIIPEQDVINYDLLVGNEKYNGWTVTGFEVKPNEKWFQTSKGKNGWIKQTSKPRFTIENGKVYYVIPLYPDYDDKGEYPYKLYIKAIHEKYGNKSLGMTYPKKMKIKSSQYRTVFPSVELPLDSEFTFEVNVRGSAVEYKDENNIIDSITIQSIPAYKDVVTVEVIKDSMTNDGKVIKFNVKAKILKAPTKESPYEFYINIHYLYNKESLDEKYSEVAKTVFTGIVEITYDQFSNPEDSSKMKFTPIPRDDF